MRSLPPVVRAGAVSLALALAVLNIAGAPSSALASDAEAQSVGPCGLSQAAFCDTFDQPAGTGNRSGQLNGTVWGVSHATGADNNSGQGQFNAWSSTELQTCAGMITVHPPNDFIICNGQLREAVNDNHTVTTLAMYPKQPFDFAGRTGVVAFDVSNDTVGGHSEWPEFWITDQPVPTPFTFENSWKAAPQHAFGVRLSAASPAQQGTLLAPGCPNDAHPRWSVDNVVVIRNHVVDDEQDNGATHVTRLGCVIGSSGPGDMNHLEFHVSQNQIEVYATDAGTTAPLIQIGVVSNANLSFTRGLVWIEDNHYNGDKFGGNSVHTFAWSNVGFDGPVLARDLAFDALDAVVPVASYSGQFNLGWNSLPSAPATLTVPGVSGIESATACLLTFNFFPIPLPSTLTYVVNGHAHSLAWPYPDKQGYTWRTLAVPVPLAEVVPSDNVVSIASDAQMTVANVDLILVGAGGVVPVSAPGSVTNVATPTSVPWTPYPTDPPAMVVPVDDTQMAPPFTPDDTDDGSRE